MAAVERNSQRYRGSKAVDIQADRTAALLGNAGHNATEQGQGDNQPQFFALFGRLRTAINFASTAEADRRLKA